MSKISLLLRNRRVLLSLVVILILAVAIPILAFALKDKLITSKKIQPKLVKETTAIQAALESHPKLFLADIEYNPQTGLVIQHGTAKINGDPPLLLGEEPTPDPNRFAYKILVLSKDNISLQSGWYSLPLEIAKTPLNTFRFNAVTFYEPEAILQIEIDNKTIWSVKMQ